VLEFRYTANSFVAPEQTRFKYRLVGADPDWREETKERTAHYINLKAGDYRFEVMALPAHNIWSARPADFPFSIAPYFWQTWPFYVGSGASLMAAILGLHYQRLRNQRRIQRLEHQRALQDERTRIARDLHDDLGANLTGVALQLDLARAGNDAPGPLREQLGAIAGRTRSLVDTMREVVWAMNPQFDDVESLASYLGLYTENFLVAAGLRCRLELPEQATSIPLSSRVRHQLFLVVKEALHNVVRHARASEVRLRLECQNKELRIVIADDGCGFSLSKDRVSGHGLANMEERVKALGGQFSVMSRPGHGTELSIKLAFGPGQT
jgi:signal transduction histidine kinase